MQALTTLPGELNMRDWPRADVWLLGAVTVLLCLSVVMVFSATIAADSHTSGNGFPRIYRHVTYIGVGLLVMIAVALVPSDLWQKVAKPLMLSGIVLLLLVLIPSIGREVNGSTRWIAVGVIRMQPSEIMKFIMIVYMADYLTRHRAQLKNFRLGVLNIAGIVGLVGGLLLLEPDLGTTVVITSTVFAMMYVSGVRYTHLLLCLVVAAIAFVILVAVAPYRVERVLSFQNPWADPWRSGFQLSQALIAFGRGGWFGAGLGQSIQKLFYLPHASNDFLAAVTAEELGFAGIVALLALYVLVLWRGFAIAAKAEKVGHVFAARMVHGVVIMVSLQATINLGVNMGLLPTKGLTLPLMSYGGSSMVVTLAMLGLVFSVERGMRKPAGRRSK